MPTERAISAKRGSRAAMLYMLPTVALGSLIPLAFVWGSSEDSPFLFNAAWRLGVVTGCAAFLLAAYPKVALDRRTLGAIRPRILSWAILFAVVGNFDYTLFTWSLRFVDVSVGAVLVETWPVFLTLLVYRLLGERYKPLSFDLACLTALCFVGVGFVVNSQLSVGVSETESSARNAYSVALGSLLALAGALAAALTAFIFKWSASLSRELTKRLSFQPGRESGVGELELFCIVAAYLVGSLVSFPINGVAGILSGENASASSLSIALAGGIFVQSSVSILLRKTLLVTRDLGINAMIYAKTALSLGLLWAFSMTDIARPDFLIIGVAGITASNVLINFERESRLSFKPLIIALWACGTVVYLRPADVVPLSGWAGFLFESLAAPFLACVLFTVFSALRLRQWRLSSIDGVLSYASEQRVSSFLALALFAVYAGLSWAKWLG